jgi:hypothetical protein
LGQRRCPQSDNEAIPLSELNQLALGDGHFHGLLVCEVWWLEFILLLQGLEDYDFVLLIVVEADTALPVEEVDVAEVTRERFF